MLAATVAAKLVAAGLGPAVVVRRREPHRLLVVAAWTAAGVLTSYGAVLTLVGLLVQADVVHAAADADRRALAWHAYLWDPWFLVWGVLLATALGTSRRSRVRRRRAAGRAG